MVMAVVLTEVKDVVSESEVWRDRLAPVDDDFDLGAATELLRPNAVGVRALGLREDVEVFVGFLGFVLVAVYAEFVVMHVHVLPLGARLDAEQLHELLDLDVGVAAAEGLARSEEPVFERPRLPYVGVRPRVIVIALFFVVVAIVCLASLLISFLFLVAVLVVVTRHFLTVVVFFIFLFGVRVTLLDNGRHGGRRRVARPFLHFLDRNQCVNLRVRLGHHVIQPVALLQRRYARQLVPTQEIRLVVRHVEWSEERAHERSELVVGVVDEVVFVLAELLEVVVGDGCAPDAHFLDQFSELRVQRAFVQVLQQTVFELRAINHGRVGRELFLDLPSHDVLVAQHVPHGLFIDWLALLFGVVESLPLMPVIVLLLEVLRFGQLGKFHERRGVHNIVHELLGELLARSATSVSILDQVDECSLLLIVQAAN